MARPTKYNKEIAKGVVELVKQGYNLKAAAQANGISEASVSRWRERYTDFNKEIILATKEQNSRVCHLVGVRSYTRKVSISPQYDSESLINGDQLLSEKEKVKRQPQTWLGLPIKPRPLEYDPTDYYLNPQTKRVERIDKNGVLHTCPMWLWEEKHQPKPHIWGY